MWSEAHSPELEHLRARLPIRLDEVHPQIRNDVAGLFACVVQVHADDHRLTDGSPPGGNTAAPNFDIGRLREAQQLQRTRVRALDQGTQSMRHEPAAVSAGTAQPALCDSQHKLRMILANVIEIV